LREGESKRVALSTDKESVFLYKDLSFKYTPGDILFVEGDFQRSKHAPHIYTSFNPETEKIGSSGGFLRSSLEKARSRMQRNIRREVPAPHSFLLEAIVLGNRDSFSESLNEKLSLSGTRHITAISGMHVVIISSLLFYVFSFLGFSKKSSALFSLVFVLLFVLFVGAPISAIRAGSMGGAVLLSHVFFREANPLRFMAMVAAVMLLFDPFLLHFDLGFQLSFLAAAGIICLHEPAGSLLKRVSFFKRRERLIDILSVTLSAQLMVTPLIMYNFGHVPLFSLPANLLIVPLLPAVMILGILTAITGFFVFSFPAYLLLSFVLFIVRGVANLPFAALYLEGFPFLGVVALYGGIFLGIAYFQQVRALEVEYY